MASTVAGILLFGTHASRPSSGVTAGTLYACSTHNLVYQTTDTGSTWGTWLTATGSGLSDPMTTRGDIIVRNSSNTTDRLAVGATANMALRSDGTDVGYAILPGTIIGYKADTSGDHTTTSTSLADLDATNAAVTFTAPASGNVLVRLAATCSPAPSSASAYTSWGVRESTSNIAGAVGESIAVRNASTASTNDKFDGVTKEFILTGISAGSHTYKWAWATSAGTATLKANASTPAVMTVIAL